MKYLITSILLMLTPLSTFAQETQPQPKMFYVQQACDTPEPLAELIKKYEEEPLFVGSAVQTHVSGQQLTGSVIFFVNQASGTWSLITFYENNQTACMSMSGFGFQPFTKGTQTKQ